VSQRRFERVRANRLASQRRPLRALRGVLEEALVTGRARFVEQRLDLDGKVRVAASQLCEPLRSLFRRQIQSLIEQGTQPLPARVIDNHFGILGFKYLYIAFRR
jgi:hypothetical protein